MKEHVADDHPFRGLADGYRKIVVAVAPAAGDQPRPGRFGIGRADLERQAAEHDAPARSAGAVGDDIDGRVEVRGEVEGQVVGMGPSVTDDSRVRGPPCPSRKVRG